MKAITPLLVSQAKSKLNEKDLLMMCVDNPHYLSKALGHDNADGTGLTSLDQKKEMLSYFYKAWSGLTKYIKRQCAEQGRCVDFPLVGRFIQRKSIPLAVDNETDDSDYKYTFIPHLDFVASGKFKFPQNQYNISPLSKRVPKGQTTVTVSLGAIGQSAEYDRELVASILKDVICKFVSYIL